MIASCFFITVSFLYRDLCGKEAAFNFLLPVNRKELVFSKLTVYSLWFVGTLVVCFVALSITNFIKENSSMLFINDLIRLIAQEFNMNNAITLFILSIIVVIVIFYIYSMIITALGLGQYTFNNKVFGSVIMFLILNYVFQVVASIIGFLLYLLLKTLDYSSMVGIALILFVVSSVIIICINYMVSVWIFENKINI